MRVELTRERFTLDVPRTIAKLTAIHESNADEKCDMNRPGLAT